MTNEELVAQYQSGRKEALTELYTNNRRFIYKLALKYAPEDPSLQEDLLQEGFLGMMTAAERYDPAAGVKFFSYAAHWIQRSMCKYLENGELVRFPWQIKQSLRDLTKAERALSQALERRPTDEELAKAMGVTVNLVRSRKKTRHMFGALLMLDKPAGDDDDDSEELIDLIPGDDFEEEALQEYDRQRVAQELTEILQTYPEDQQEALWGVYRDGRTARECGRSSYVAAMRKIKKSCQASPTLRDYYQSYICGFVRHVSLAEFKSTGQSEQEAALDRMEKALTNN